MEKPKICYVLGVDVGETFGFNEFDEPKEFIVNKNGEIRPNGDGCISPSDICYIINNADCVIHKPRWTDREIEDAKTICRMWPRGRVEFCRYEDGGCAIIHIQDIFHGSLDLGRVDLFESIRPGQCVILNEIFGGTE